MWQINTVRWREKRKQTKNAPFVLYRRPISNQGHSVLHHGPIHFSFVYGNYYEWRTMMVSVVCWSSEFPPLLIESYACSCSFWSLQQTWFPTFSSSIEFHSMTWIQLLLLALPMPTSCTLRIVLVKNVNLETFRPLFFSFLRHREDILVRVILRLAFKLNDRCV